MQFTHEAAVTVDAPLRALRPDWEDAARLPRLLSHLRGTAAGDAPDLARFVVVLAGRHFEFAAQRTLCSDDTVCWQSLGPAFIYVLTAQFQPAGDAGTAIRVTVAYDPPGFLPDIADSLGLRHAFAHALDADLRRYAHSLCQSAPASFALAD